AFVHQRAHVAGANLVVDRDAHDLRPGVREGADLGDGGRRVARVGVGHGLNGDGRAAADLYIARENSFCIHNAYPTIRRAMSCQVMTTMRPKSNSMPMPCTMPSFSGGMGLRRMAS